MWGAAWMYYATGNSTYLLLATNPDLAKNAQAKGGNPYYGTFSWDNKLIGAQVCCQIIFKHQTKALDLSVKILALQLLN
jgi:hypothetical protein